MKIDWVKMEELAASVAKNSYSPYSHFSVGATVLADNGQMFSASNVENSAYGSSTCAERGAVSMMVSLVGKRNIVAVIAVHLKNDSNIELITPCGNCRQILNEFGGAKVKVMINDHRVIRLGRLLTEAFGPENLERK